MVARKPKGILCQNCKTSDLLVTYTKRLVNGTVRRYRRCRSCKARVVTVERVHVAPLALKHVEQIK